MKVLRGQIKLSLISDMFIQTYTSLVNIYKFILFYVEKKKAFKFPESFCHYLSCKSTFKFQSFFLYFLLQIWNNKNNNMMVRTTEKLP